MKKTDPDFRSLVDLEHKLATLSIDVRRVMDESGLTRRELAERLGHDSPSTVQRVASGAAYRATVETVARIAWACGYELRVDFVERGRSSRSAASELEGKIVDFDPWLKSQPAAAWRGPHGSVPLAEEPRLAWGGM